LRRVKLRHGAGGGQKHAFQEDSAFANVDETRLEHTISADTTTPGVAHLMKRIANQSASVRQLLLNRATERKEDLCLLVTRYGLERFLDQRSVSRDRDSFALRGAPARMVPLCVADVRKKLPRSDGF
jgi:hypothetical protein